MKRIYSGLMALAMGAMLPAGPAKADATPLIGDVMIVGFNFCPRGWAKADGQLLAISQYTALFSILGTIYGGDGRTSFALPDLRGRYVVGNGNGPGLSSYSQGQRGGSETVTMNVLEMASHNHLITSLPVADVKASTLAPDSPSPSDKSLATFPPGHAAGEKIYATDQTTAVPMGARSVTLSATNIQVVNTGGSQSVNNMQPSLALTVCVALEGTYPSRS